MTLHGYHPSIDNQPALAGGSDSFCELLPLENTERFARINESLYLFILVDFSLAANLY